VDVIKTKKPVFLPRKGVRSESRRRTFCRGQTLVEYALIIAVLAIVCVGVLLTMGQQVQSIFTNLESKISSGEAAASH
jgi:Flp pilus assembly pilin Flp